MVILVHDYVIGRMACPVIIIIGSSDNDSEQTVSPDEIKSSVKNVIKETIADKTESNLLEIENEIEK